MKSRPIISTTSPEEWGRSKYDLAIFALGFESRSTCFVNEIANSAKTSVAFGFNHAQERSYQSNLENFLNAGVQTKESLDDPIFESELKSLLKKIKDDTPAKLFIDISCFTRFRLAAIVNEIFKLTNSFTHQITIDFAYSLAEFEKPNAHPQPNTIVGPAHPAFAGWSQGSYSSTAIVLGLGYEQDQAMGVVEYLQAGEVWAFAPNSPVQEYKPEVDNANQLLLSELAPNHVLEYDVCAPASVIATLESVVRGLNVEHSVVLVPFGPKIFVLCSLIVAAMRQDVAVWRVSQGNQIFPHDRIASDIKIGVSLSFLETPKPHAEPDHQPQ